jgi:large subunit ribosomal protein L6
MSRIGKRPVAIPAGVTVTVDGQQVTVKGPKGTLQRRVHPEMGLALEGAELAVRRPSEAPRHKALHGLTRTLLANMVEGVSKGYEKILEIQGVGYKAEANPKGITMIVGYSHPVPYPAPAGITLTIENNTVVRVAGADKEMVGQVAAELRAVRPPEPYKGKGVRYRGEQVRRKAGKTGAK